MEDLQKQYDAITAAIDKVRTVLDSEIAKTDVVAAVELRMEEREVYALLARINAQLLANNDAEAEQAYDELVAKYDRERLLGNTEDGFDADINKLFEAVENNLAEDTAEETE